MLSCKDFFVLIINIWEVFVLDIFKVFNSKLLKFVEGLLSYENQIHSVARIMFIIEFL